MKKSLKASSIVEALIVLLIVVVGITGVYGLLNSSQNLVNASSNRIEAIQIARDGLEAFTNIRDTNWIRYAADYDNCWNTLNYDISCIGSASVGTDISAGSYKIFQTPENRFELVSISETGGYADDDYRREFAVHKDSLNFYTQTGTVVNYGVGNTPFYTREIQVSYPDGNSNTDRIEVKSIVGWNDNPQIKELEMSMILTNWRAKQ